jgi:hypothetical protein
LGSGNPALPLNEEGGAAHMRKSLVAVAVLLLSGCIGSAQDKSPVRVVIQATPEQIKKAVMTMFARNGYSLNSDTALLLKISKPFNDEEMVVA